LIKTSLIKISHCYEQHLYFAGKRRGVRINVRRVFELNWTSRRVGLYFWVSLWYLSLSLSLSLFFSFFFFFFSSFPSFFIARNHYKLNVLTAYSSSFSSSTSSSLQPFDPSWCSSPRKSSLSSLISQGFRAFRGEIVSTTKGLKLRAESISVARAKRQITINDEVASQLRPSRNQLKDRSLLRDVTLLRFSPFPFMVSFALLRLQRN